MGTETYAVFIRRVPMSEDHDWTLFANPFNADLWKFLLLYSMVCTVAIMGMEKTLLWLRGKALTGSASRFCGDLIFTYWVAFMSNFGGRPPKNRAYRLPSLRTLIFVIFLVANVIFIAYR